MRMLLPAISGTASRQQAKALGELARLEERKAQLDTTGWRHREAVQGHAVRMMEVLGPHRLLVIEQRRARSSVATGEAWVWADAARRIGAASP